MRSPAAAIAWELRQKHRWGLIAVIAYLASIRLFFLKPARIVFHDTESFALVVVVPLTATFIYFLAVFSFGLAGDLAARQSMYPARMFTLPVTTAALAGWPMLYGTLAMALLWLATRFLAVWPAEVDVPILWPALLAASLLAWTQALTWRAYALPGLRVIVTVVWLATIDAVVLLALHFHAREVVMLAILSPHVPLAFLVARGAVARARRGEIPDWGRFFTWAEDVLPRRRTHFPSAARAQMWFEWRRHGRSLPALVGILLPFELALLFVFRDTPAIVFEILVSVLLTPPLMAAFAAATISKANPHGSDAYGLTPFIATRPLKSASLIAAKLKVTVASTLAAWLLVIIAVPLALRLSVTSTLVVDWIHELIRISGTPRAIVIVFLGFSVLMAATWKQLVQSLYIGLSGREWVVKASVFITLSLLAVIVPLGNGIITDRFVVAVLWNAFPWIAAVLVCLKLAAAVWIAIRLCHRRLLSNRTLIIGAVCWDVVVFALYGLLVWLVPMMLIPSYLLALVAILEVPLARLSAAPLALAWNRHR
jgi:hypothetical protein